MRYAVDTSKISKVLGWQPRIGLDRGLDNTIQWYLANRTWWETIRESRYGGQRLGRLAPARGLHSQPNRKEPASAA